VSHDDRNEGNNGRRDLLKTLVVVGSAAFGCALAAPAAVFVAAPLLRGKGSAAAWVKTVKLDDLAEGIPKKVAIVADQRDAWTVAKDVDLGSVWLVRHGAAVAALSVECPHLGCAVQAIGPNAGGYGCPCHTSSFDPAGKKLGGPAPRDMDSLATRIEDGFVLVEFKRFRIGVPDREEIV
jgi:menaquinol-cytochrome c reductase iron-sulfur subunit